MRRVEPLSILLAASCCAPSLAQGAANTPRLRYSERHGLPFTHIGAVGNNPTLMRRIDFPIDSRLMGRVDHEYAIMTREVTNGEFLGFARAVAPFIDDLGITGPSFFAGDGLSVQLVGDGYSFGVSEGRSPDEPIRTSFYAAALYANWLHNGQGATIEAFQDGAYDASTFRRVPDKPPVPQGQPAHHDGARFWIPTMDEWVKAGYYDPDRFGEGQGGWWGFPNASDAELIPGRPELGGQTNAGDDKEWPSEQERPHEVGMYPETQSPWGLLDVSGGASEWTETLLGGSSPRLSKGTDARYGGDLYADAVEYFGYASPLQFGGIRLAAAIPSPSSGGVALLAGGVVFLQRRRRPCEFLCQQSR